MSLSNSTGEAKSSSEFGVSPLAIVEEHDVVEDLNRDGFAGGQIIYMASRLSDSLVS
jgi:hypothetical protein